MRQTWAEQVANHAAYLRHLQALAEAEPGELVPAEEARRWRRRFMWLVAGNVLGAVLAIWHLVAK